MNLFQTNSEAIKYIDQHSNILKSISEPLTKFLSINSFHYFKLYPNGRYLYLGNNFEYLKSYLQNVPDNGQFFNQQLRKATNNHYYSFTWPNIMQINDPVTRALNEYSINNGLSLYRRSQDYVESWHFADTLYRININEYYEHNKNLFEEFIKYFNCKASHLIYSNDIDSRYAFYTTNSNLEIIANPYIEPNSDKFINCIHSEMRMSSAINLTLPEKQCIHYLSKGLSAKLIGQHLDLSYRTIESYLDNIRKKSGLRKNIEIIKFFESKY